MSVIGTLYRDAGDDYPVSVSFASVDVFTSDTVTSATVSVSPTDSLTLGSTSVASNVVTFRVSGGTNGTFSIITIVATNASGYDINRSLAVDTQDL